VSERAANSTHHPNPIARIGWKISALFALFMGVFLLGGLLLDGSWSAEASWTVEAPPESVYALLESPARWDEWAPAPGMSFTYEGPSGGQGARRSWDEPEVGSGSFVITEAQLPQLVRYRVDVQGGDLVTLGTLQLDPADRGTRVTWREDGDFGGNPLLSWAALAMKKKHGAELERRLQDLAAVAEGRPLLP